MLFEEVAAGGDIAQRLFDGRAHGVSDTGLQALRIVACGKAGLAAVVERGRDGLVTHLGPPLDIGAHMDVEAEDLLDHDDAALARDHRRLVIGGELEAIFAGDLDRFGHGPGPP